MMNFFFNSHETHNANQKKIFGRQHKFICISEWYHRTYFIKIIITKWKIFGLNEETGFSYLPNKLLLYKWLYTIPNISSKYSNCKSYLKARNVFHCKQRNQFSLTNQKYQKKIMFNQWHFWKQMFMCFKRNKYKIAFIWTYKNASPPNRYSPKMEYLQHFILIPVGLASIYQIKMSYFLLCFLFPTIPCYHWDYHFVELTGAIVLFFSELQCIYLTVN